jgi:hypothetical protein
MWLQHTPSLTRFVPAFLLNISKSQHFHVTVILARNCNADVVKKVVVSKLGDTSMPEPSITQEWEPLYRQLTHLRRLPSYNGSEGLLKELVAVTAAFKRADQPGSKKAFCRSSAKSAD